jgi:predicted CXXCH cytochrome family protein
MTWAERTEMLMMIGGCMAAFATCAAGHSQSEAVPHAHQLLVQRNGGFALESDGQVINNADLARYCTGCHPKSADEIGRSGGSPAAHANHPVDVPYPRENPDFVPTAELDPKLRLVDGKLSCITCHSPRAANRALVIRLEDGELCLACHRR